MKINNGTVERKLNKQVEDIDNIKSDRHFALFEIKKVRNIRASMI